MASTNRGFLPQTDPALLSWSVNFSTLITAMPTAYGLTALQAASYQAVHDIFAEKYQISQDPSTRTRPAIAAKDQARFNLKYQARLLAKLVEGTASVTDAQKYSLGLNVRAMPSPIPVPGMRPGTDIVSVAGRTVRMHIHDSASSNKRGKPAGVALAWVYSYVGETYPSDPTEWNFEGATTRANFAIVFPNTVAGGTQVWVCAAWVNAKQQAGPTSIPVTTNLQGGGSSSSTMKIAA